MGSASQERDSKKGIFLTLRIGVYLGFGFLLWMVIQPFPHHPTVAEKRKDFGDSFIYKGAPFCCIYIGLDNKEAALFSTNFWRFAEQHNIRRPKKHYSAYSGPPLATCKNDHVSVFIHTIPTTDLISRSQRSAGLTSNESVSWEAGIWTDCYWPTNACRITKNGQEIIAPLSGVVKLAPNDTNYSLRDFILLSDELTGTLQSAFPDRAVRIFSYHGDKQSN